jgi:hypothetical protein
VLLLLFARPSASSDSGHDDKILHEAARRVLAKQHILKIQKSLELGEVRVLEHDVLRQSREVSLLN